jgi:hypothetical protein
MVIKPTTAFKPVEPAVNLAYEIESPANKQNAEVAEQRPIEWKVPFLAT